MNKFERAELLKKIGLIGAGSGVIIFAYFI
jgi:hypothetical protein